LSQQNPGPANYANVEDQLHKALYGLNVGADFVFAEEPDFTGDATELLSQRPVAAGERLAPGPWDIAVVRECARAARLLLPRGAPRPEICRVFTAESPSRALGSHARRGLRPQRAVAHALLLCSARRHPSALRPCRDARRDVGPGW